MTMSNANQEYTPILYILMRNDLASLNPGKAVAQGAHAANVMQTRIDQEGSIDQKAILSEWLGDRGFGTTITLSVDDRQMQKILDLHTNHPRVQNFSVAGVVVDPTYPLRDGATTHLIPLRTCGYLFGLKEDIGYMVSGLELMA